MNDTLEAYNSLQMLKRIDEKHLKTHYNLRSRIDKDSKNRLIICRSKKDCREAIKFIAKDYLDRAEIDMSNLKIKIYTRKKSPLRGDFLLLYKFTICLT